MHTSGPAYLDRTTPCQGVDVLRAYTSVEGGGFHDDQLSALQPMISDYLAENRIDDYVVWFYTPMALPLLGDLAPRAIVYDCMDELAAFKNAPRQMRQRETALLKSADLVVTGGPRLYEAKRDANANVLCLPSAVDAEHYAARRAPSSWCRRSRAVATPRLGYFGVIDERLDLELVARIADADPEWQVVMVGPVVKIDEAALPRRPNIHYLGQQPYALLPQLVAGWNVCLMPFALNESTEFISPTKTLEYMAAGKPVISTPIHDVRAMFGDIVAIAPSADLFIAACRQALRESPVQKADREQRMAERVRKYSWDAAAETIRRSLDEVLAAPRTSAAGFAAKAAGVSPARLTSPSVALASLGAGQRPDDDSTAQPKVASAG